MGQEFQISGDWEPRNAILADVVPHLLQFRSDRDITGTLFYEDGKFKFKGDAEASALQFFNLTSKHFGIYLDAHGALVFEQIKAQALALILSKAPPDKPEIYEAIMQVHNMVLEKLALPKESDRVDHPYDATESGPWIIASWPDGTWCNWIERHQYAHKSDDYEKLEVLSHDEGYCPVRTRPYVNPETMP